jgi:predicted chitinase
MEKELVDLKTLAPELGYSIEYLKRNWPRLLPGVLPRKTYAKARKIQFYRKDIEKLLEQPK